MKTIRQFPSEAMCPIFLWNPCPRSFPQSLLGPRPRARHRGVDALPREELDEDFWLAILAPDKEAQVENRDLGRARKHRRSGSLISRPHTGFPSHSQTVSCV
eukprot:956620-Heterocapsa_arctica.AAC.1